MKKMNLQKKKLSAGTANDNYKEVVIKNKPIINNKRLSGIIKFPEKIQKKIEKKVFLIVIKAANIYMID